MITIFNPISVNVSVTSATELAVNNTTLPRCGGWFLVSSTATVSIISNTDTTLTVDDTSSLPVSPFDATIIFVERGFLSDIDSDFNNVNQITDNLIASKYRLTNRDVSNQVFSYLREYYTSNFDPLRNILNLDVLQVAFSFKLAEYIFKDLVINTDSMEAVKGFDLFYKQYLATIKDVLPLLQLDFGENGQALPEVLRNAPSTLVLMDR
jgi:hypothetical protein